MSTFFKNPNPTPGAGTSFSDVEVQFGPTPVRRLVLASKIAGGHIYFHLMPLNKVASGGVLPITGREAWLSLTEYPVLSFNDPIRKFYVSGDGVPPDFMLMGTDDVDDLEIEAVNPTASTQAVNLTQEAGVVLSAPTNDAPTGAEVAPVVRIIPRKKTVIETTTVLGGGATFTGPWHDSELDGTAFVVARSFSPQVGASFLIEVTDDTGNASLTAGAAIVSTPAAGALVTLQAVIQSRFWRVRYVNGAGAQASFELTSCSIPFGIATGATVSGQNSGATNVPVVVGGSGSPIGDNDVSTGFKWPLNNGTTAFIASPTLFYGGAFSGTADPARQGWSRVRTPTVFRTVATAATGSTAVWTAAANNKWRLLKFRIDLSGNVSQAAAGILTIQLLDVASGINIVFKPFVPGAAGTTAGNEWSTGWIDLGQFGILAAAVATALNVNLSAALATGTCNVIVCGTEE